MVLRPVFQARETLLQTFGQPLGIVPDFVDPSGGVILVFIEPAGQLHDGGLDRLHGVRRRALPTAGFQRPHAVAQLVLTFLDAVDAVAGGGQFRLRSLAGPGDLFGQLGDGLVDAAQRAGRHLLRAVDTLSQAIDHRA